MSSPSKQWTTNGLVSELHMAGVCLRGHGFLKQGFPALGQHPMMHCDALHFPFSQMMLTEHVEIRGSTMRKIRLSVFKF